LETRAVHFFEHPALARAPVSRRQDELEMLPLGACVALEVGRQRWVTLLNRSGSFIWTREELGVALVLLSTVMAIAVPMKIWNNTRIEMNLEQHQQLLLKARMDALSAQINPISVQYAQYRFVVDSIRSGHGSRRGHQVEQYFAPPAAQA